MTHTLYRLLANAQKADDSVYLSLAGGRKNMSALMAILVPLFPCVKKLYHLIDRDENSPHRYHFKTIEDIVSCPVDERLAYLNPDPERLRPCLLDPAHGIIPAHLHFKTPNPYIAWDKLPIAIPSASQPWQARNGVRLAGVSSFGWGGTNCHIVLL